MLLERQLRHSKVGFYSQRRVAHRTRIETQLRTLKVTENVLDLWSPDGASAKGGTICRKGQHDSLLVRTAAPPSILWFIHPSSLHSLTACTTIN